MKHSSFLLFLKIAIGTFWDNPDCYQEACSMWRNLFCSILFLLYFSSTYSQSDGLHSRKIDSLVTLIKTDQPDTSKVIHLYKLAREFEYVNPDSAILIANQALELATAITNSPLAAKNTSVKKRAERSIAQSYAILGLLYYSIAEYDLAISYHLKSLEKYTELNFKPGIGMSFNNIGNVYSDQGDHPKALEYYFKALKIDKELDDKWHIAKDLNNIGNVYNDLGNFQIALDYFLKGLKIGKVLGDKYLISALTANIGLAYQNLNDFDKALEYYFKALKIDEELDDKYCIAVGLGNIGSVYKQLGNNPKALEYYFNALEVSETIGAKRLTAAWLGGIGTIYGEEKKYKEAEEYVLKALNISTDIGELNLMKDQSDLLSELYAKTNQYDLAYKYHVEYSTFKDSLFNEDKSKEIGSLEARHEMEMVEMEEAKRVEVELRIKKEKRNRRYLLQYSGIAILLLIIGLIISLLGFVKVSPSVAKAVTFFAFLLFFEFLIVMLDPYINKYSGGEPAYSLLINAAIAACIFPVHAVLERVLIKRLVRLDRVGKVKLARKEKNK